MANSPGGVEVGRVSVRVVPNTSTLRSEIKAELDKIEKELGLTLRVGVDTNGIGEDIDKERQRQERDPIKVPVKAPTDAFAANIRAEALKLSKTVQVDLPLTAEGERLRTEIATQVALIEAVTKIDIPLDLEDAAVVRNKMAIELDILKLMASQANPTVDIHTEVDAASLARATAEIEGASAAASGLSTGLEGMAGTALILGPALIPLIATIGALGAALVAPLAVAGGGLTIFGVLTGLAVVQTLKQKKQIDALAKAVDTAKTSLANTAAAASASASASLTTAQASAANSLASAKAALAVAKTASAKASAHARINAANATLAARQTTIQKGQSAAVAAAQRKVNEAVTAYHDALSSLTPAQKAFLDAQDRLHNAFRGLITAAGPALLGPITQVINLLTTITPTIKPILDAVAGVLSGIIKHFQGLVKDPSYKQFIDSFAKQLGPDILAFSRIAGNVFLGLFGLFGAFGKALGGKVLGSLVKLTGKFAQWGKQLGESKGFKDFVKWLDDNGPKVIAALGLITGAVADMVIAFAPVGTTILTDMGKLAGAISKIPADKLATIAGSLVALAVGAKLVGPLSAVFGLLTGPIGLAVVAVALLVVGFIGLYHSSKPLRGLLQDLGDFFKTQLLPIIEKAATGILPAVTSAFDDISKSIKDNRPFLELMGKLFLTLASAIIVAGIVALVIAIRAIGKAVPAVIHVVHSLVDAVLELAQFGVRAFTVFAKGVLGAFGAIIDGAVFAFGWIKGIGPKLHTAQDSFHHFADNTIASLDRTAARIKALQDQIDRLHGKSFRVNIANNNALVNQLQAIDDFQLSNKSFTVTANDVEIQRGPGGGTGGHIVPRSSGAVTNNYYIQAHDYADFLRQLAAHNRGRNGGGVDLGGHK